MGIAAAPSALAAPDCTPDGVNATVSSAAEPGTPFLLCSN
jgi:hypothetical protein